MLSYVVQTAASTHPITKEDLKVHSRIDGNFVDEELDRIIAAATDLLQEQTRRQFVNAVFDWYLDSFPTDGCFRPPRSPLVSVGQITYTDDDGASQTWASSNYDVDVGSEPGRIVLAYDATAPDNRDGTNSMSVRFTAGYGTARADVPARARQALLMLCGEMYEQREASVASSFQFIPSPAAQRLIAMLRIREFA